MPLMNLPAPTAPRRPFSLALFLVASLMMHAPTTSRGQTARQAPALPAVAEAVQKALDAHEVAGAITVVGGPDRLLHLDAAGYADIASQRPMTPDTIFWIASMSKPVTAAALMMLQEEGKLDIHDPVSKFIPEFAALKAPDGQPARITIEHIMNHTSGLGEISYAEAARCATLEQAVALYVTKPLQFTPGAKWAYCQSGINTGGRIIEIASGQSLPEFLKERLFDPLGMKDTTFYLDDEQAARLATSYSRSDDGALTPSPIRFLNGTAPTSHDRFPAANGGLFSTATDYARFARMILNEGTLDGRRFLKPETVKLMTSLHTGDLTTGFTPGNGWGIGWCVVRQPQGASAALAPGSFGHGGAYGTQIWIDPARRRYFLLMVQRADYPNSDASPLRTTFQDAAAAALTP
jgi:CubicO group peptidase (beta-lactamase class C family)